MIEEQQEGAMELEMKIRGLMMDPVTNMPIVVLKDVQGNAILPIWVGVYEANAIALEIEKVQTPRPMTHDLLKNVFLGLDVRVDKIVVNELKDDTFDLVVSIFGAMFAPKPFDVAKEMVRVTKPGGRIVMVNWIPNDPTLVAQILKTSAAYSPPPPEGFVSPMTWGVESNVVERFGAAGIPKENISLLRDTYVFNFPGKPSELVDAFRKYYGPTMNAFEAAEKNGKGGDLQKELEALFNSQNKSPGKDTTSIPATFLRVTVAVQ